MSAHEHTGWGRDKTNDCPGCATEYHERRAVEMQRSMENTHIAEWFRSNAPKFVEKFLAETYPQVNGGES
jgi:pyruvoyl-dependent arginine decarboxylase (PvlArgDC)